VYSSSSNHNPVRNPTPQQPSAKLKTTPKYLPTQIPTPVYDPLHLPTGCNFNAQKTYSMIWQAIIPISITPSITKHICLALLQLPKTPTSIWKTSLPSLSCWKERIQEPSQGPAL